LDNKITGNFGGNHLFGLAGADTLSGGGGNDTLVGGAGRDVFTREHPSGEGVDVITDFEIGTGPTGDFLDITDMLVAGGKDIFNEGTSALSDFARVVLDGKGNTLVQVDANGGHNSFVTVFVLQGVELTSTQLVDQVLTEHPT
jgi:Ca2+-binding RTX toxin-like protein